MLSAPDKCVLPPMAPRLVRRSTATPASGGRQSATPVHLRDVHIPGEVGVWVFIIGDLVVFGMFFVTFAVYRTALRAVSAGNEPDVRVGQYPDPTYQLLVCSTGGRKSETRREPGIWISALSSGPVWSRIYCGETV